MRYQKLFSLNVMALCCVLGLFTKKMINPFANVITEALRIPGGISTGFSILFLIIAAELIQVRHSGIMMGTVQGLLALALGRVGSMGIFAPIGYIMPGIAIDLVYRLMPFGAFRQTERMVLANSLAAITASVSANFLVFHLRDPALWLYLCVSATSGTIYGFLGSAIVTRISAVFQNYRRRYSHEKA